MRYDYVFFDLDGTIVDSEEGITRSVEYALNKFQIDVPDRKSLRCFIGPPLVESFMKFYGFDDEQAIKACGFYRERYRVKGVYENTVYEGIPDLLKRLSEKGVKIALATSKPEVFAKIVLEDMGVMEYFTYVAGAEMDDADGGRKNYRTKKEDVISHALSEMGITDKSRVLMAGDRKHDIIGANLNGIDSVGVLYGFGSREEFEKEKATYIVEKPLDILGLLEG